MPRVSSHVARWATPGVSTSRSSEDAFRRLPDPAQPVKTAMIAGAIKSDRVGHCGAGNPGIRGAGEVSLTSGVEARADLMGCLERRARGGGAVVPGRGNPDRGG